MKKIFAHRVIVAIVLGLSLAAPASATLPPTYPMYGYNAPEHICQIKQASETDKINQDLVGSYGDLRECRRNHPEILLFTGLGIVLWPFLFGLIMLNHLFFATRILHKKATTLEKKMSVIWDALLMSFAISILILLMHFFSIPSTTYTYDSDIDRILYTVFIDSRIALFSILLYLLVYAVVALHEKTKS